MRSFSVRLSRSFCGEGLMEMLKLKIIKTTSRKVFTKVSGTAWNVDYPRLAFHRKSKAIFSSYLWSRLVPQLKNAFAIFHPRLRVLLQRRRSQAKQISIMPESINRKERQSIISRKITWRKSFGAFRAFPSSQSATDRHTEISRLSNELYTISFQRDHLGNERRKAASVKAN